MVEETGAPVRGAGRLIAAAALAASLMPLNSTMVAVALPEIGSDLQRPLPLLTQALVASYLVTGIVLQSPGGKLGDRIGHLRALGLGQAVLAAGAVLGYFAGSLPALVAARVAMAAGGAVLVPSATALLRNELPVERRGRAFGTFGAVMALAAAVGPLLGGELVRRFGWPSIFLANVPVLAVSALLAFGQPGRARAAERPTPAPRFDLVGSLLLGACLALTVFGLRGSGSRHWLLFGLGLVGFVPFALWERRAADPVVDFALFRRRVFSAGSALVALQNLAMYALMFELPHVTKELFALDARGTGRLLAAMTAAMVVTSPIAGRLTDRFGARVIALCGSISALAAVGLMLGSRLDDASALLPPLALLGAGLALSSAPAQASTMSAVPRDQSGMAAGLSSTLRYLGGIAGIAVLGFVVGDTTDPSLVRHEHQTALFVFAAALALSVVAAVFLPNRGLARRAATPRSSEVRS